ncbi:MAG: hypothetical protein JW874_10220 [Spirochaetales bacterium]|nr:hypothetical protein [Spirochaetales bacterium]
MDCKKIIVDAVVALADGYEKLKDCLSEELKDGLEDLETEMLDIGKDIAFELMKRKNSNDGSGGNKPVHKVNVRFGGEKRK